MIRRDSKRSAAFIQCHTKKSPPPKVNIVSAITAGLPVWQNGLYFSSHKSVKCWRRLSLRIFTPHIFCLPAIENSKRFPRDFVFCHERFPQIFCLPYFLVVLPQLKSKSFNKLQKLSTGPDSNLFRLKSWNKKTSQKLWLTPGIPSIPGLWNWPRGLYWPGVSIISRNGFFFINTDIWGWIFLNWCKVFFFYKIR